MNTTTMPHQGRAVKRIREILGVKQDALAIDLGLSQQAVSLLEQKETLDAPTLEKIATILKVPVEAFQNFDEDQAVNIIASTFHDEAFIGNSGGTFNINPLDKILKLHQEKIELYERMLKEKEEMMKQLTKLIDRMK